MQPQTLKLDYRAPGDAVAVRVAADRVTLLIEGPPQWWQAVRALALTLPCVCLCVAFLWVAWDDGQPSLSKVALVAAGVVGVCALIGVRELRQSCGDRPRKFIYHLTSRHLTPDSDPQTFYSDPPNVIRVVDVLPGARGGTLLLRLVPGIGPSTDVVWRGSSDDLDRLAAELRQHLGFAAKLPKDAISPTLPSPHPPR